LRVISYKNQKQEFDIFIPYFSSAPSLAAPHPEIFQKDPKSAKKDPKSAKKDPKSAKKAL